MPSITTFVTTALTVSSFISTTTAQSGLPIDGLPECAQTVIFTSLTESQCNPANFPCICDELSRLGVGAAIEVACPSEDVFAFQSFLNNLCPPINAPVPALITPGPVVIPINTTNTTVLPIPPINSTTPVTVIINPPSPPSGGTGGAGGSGGESGSSGDNGGDSSSPAAPGSGGEGFQGAAAAVEVPGIFGIRTGLVAGAVGFMGLAFAEL